MGNFRLDVDNISTEITEEQAIKLHKQLDVYLERVRLQKQEEDFKKKDTTYLDDDTISDVANDLKSMAHHTKKTRSKRVLFFLKEVKPILKDKNLKVIEFNINSFGIDDGVNQVDFYPSTFKVFVKHWKKKWGVIRNSKSAEVIADQLITRLL